MRLLQLNTDDLHAPHCKSLEESHPLWQTIERFLSDCENERSSFFNLPLQMAQHAPWENEIEQIQPLLASRVGEIETFFHLGIGGSSLGSETIVRALGITNAPTFHFLDSLDPDHLWDLLNDTNPQTSLIYVVTKSGSTLETMAQFLILYEWISRALGHEEAKKKFVFCTDPHKGDLRKLSELWKIPTFTIPSQLGGRFSVLSAVGLFPALVAGVDCTALIKGARDYQHFLLGQIQNKTLPDVFRLAQALIAHNIEQKRNVTVLMPYSQKLKLLGAWFTQLWAEGLGKNGKGMSPIAATGPTDQHSILQLLKDGPQDKVVGFLEITGFQHILEIQNPPGLPKLDALDALSDLTLNQIMDAEFNATRQVLSNNKRPHFTLSIPKLSAHTLGQLFFFFETLTAFSGYLLDLDPYDQPGVEEGKKIAMERLLAIRGLAKNSK